MPLSVGSAPEPSVNFEAGTVISERYRIVALLGRGGMGAVYRADDLKLGQQVALKLLPSSFGNNERALEMLFNEVKTARQISHSNICRVYDVGESGGRHFLTMEYIDGENLASLLRRIGRPSPAKALELTRQICAGLAAAHEQGILHRDLKPSNLMIDGHGRARLADFGLAGLADQISGPEISFGTPAYMAPEQRAGQQVSVASDLFALGLVLYELFTGRRAFAAKDPEELRKAHETEAPVRPSQIVDGLDPAVERVILQCLEKDPRDRPSSAAQVADLLTGADSRGDLAFLKTVLACRVAFAEGEGPERDSLWRSRARELAEEARELESNHCGDLQLTFARPIGAVRYALSFHRATAELAKQEGAEWETRVGIHLGEVVSAETAEAGIERRTLGGPAEAILTRLVGLAANGQTLLSRGVFDLARQSSDLPGEDVHWLAHGSYECTGLAEPLDVCEVGVTGVAPLAPPSESAEARRRLVQETIAGWRPAPGLELPRRPNWIVKEKISEGGFGEVWLVAHGKTHERRVFKFCYDPEKLRALQREITLFRLLKETLGDRDDITRILDWSFDEAPYFIESEYTEGGSLVEWSAEEGGLSAVPLETRLEIVAQVARALAAAHSVGVLHKDVKPANVLVEHDAEGQVRARLSDFGVGLVTEKKHLLEAGITVMGMTEATTITGSSFTGTRLYMAPEVMEGRPATLQADIYALGVVLFQMVVGDFSRALAPGWERQVDDELLRGDIAAAVDGALEQRLSSASVLAERLEMLEKRRAEQEARRREEERVERAMTALVKNRRRWRVSIAVMVLVLVFAGAMAFMWRRVSHEAEVARQVSNFLVELFEIAAPEESLGNTVTARELLDRGAANIEGNLADQPEVQGRLMRTMGGAYRGLGLYNASAPLFEKSLELHRELYGKEDVRTMAVLGEVADIERLRGNYDVAETLAREALRVREERFGKDHLEVAESSALLGRVFQHIGIYDDSELFYRRALEIRESRLGDRHLEVARVLGAMGKMLIEKRSYAEAEVLLVRALEIRRDSLGEENIEFASNLTDVGYVLFLENNQDEAERLLRKSLAIQWQLYGKKHPALTDDLNILALILQQNGRLTEAEGLLKQALDINGERRGYDHPFYAGSLGFLANLHARQGKYEEAIRLFEEALHVYKESLGEKHPDVAATMRALGKVYSDLGDYDRAQTLFSSAVEIHRLSDSEGMRLAWGLYFLAGALDMQGDHGGSARALTEALIIARSHHGGDAPQVGIILVALAKNSMHKMDYDNAAGLAKKALKTFENGSMLGVEQRIDEARAVLGEALHGLGNLEEAGIASPGAG